MNDNLEESERVALHRLKTNKTITIKAADKGGGWVIMNTRDYIEKVLHLLNDRKFYQKLDFDPTLSNANEITSFVDYLLLRGRITETTAKYMYPVYPLEHQLFMAYQRSTKLTSHYAQLFQVMIPPLKTYHRIWTLFCSL